MATISPLPPETGLDQFRAALPSGTGNGRIADALCALGEATHLARGAELAPDPETDRLVWLASGAAKLIARGAGKSAAAYSGRQVLAFHFAGDLVSVLRQSEGDFRLVALAECELVIFPSDRFLDLRRAIRRCCDLCWPGRSRRFTARAPG